MLTSVDIQNVHAQETAGGVRHVKRLLTRRIWLPKFVYDCLPWFYLSAGVLALLATIFVGDWFWILPYYFLFAAGCLHFGIFVLTCRANQVKAAGPE
jgi:hypothetical protein